MNEEDANKENYEQMSVGSGDAPEPTNLLSNKNNKNNNNKFIKNKINIFFILIIVILGIYNIYKLSYLFSLSEQINQYENEINNLSTNEISLKKNYTNLIEIKNKNLDEKNEINIEIKNLKEENKGIDEKNKEMIEQLKDRQKIINNFEEEINENKQLLTNIIFQQNKLRDKIKNCDERIDFYKLKIEDLKQKQ